MIRHATSAPFHPSTNGMAERMVRITKDALKKLTYGDWHHRLADFLLAYRTTPSTSTGKSPAELRWGRKLITKLDRLHPDRLPPKATQPRAPRYLQVGAPVWTRNYGPGDLWVPAVVCKVTGPLSYEVSLDDGRVLRRHIDQLRTRLDLPSETPGLFPGGGRGTIMGKGMGVGSSRAPTERPQTAYSKIPQVFQTGIHGN
ncbi:macrophage mannose receptor 1-like [Crotalus adamanteus]|uniref:Macrophage mannose receptor 1-like n=1 Tax=Crotalus adamanteus TaxID=8729 RepID=A0AAW1B228_CROAD